MTDAIQGDAYAKGEQDTLLQNIITSSDIEAKKRSTALSTGLIFPGKARRCLQ